MTKPLYWSMSCTTGPPRRQVKERIPKPASVELAWNDLDLPLDPTSCCKPRQIKPTTKQSNNHSQVHCWILTKWRRECRRRPTSSIKSKKCKKRSQRSAAASRPAEDCCFLRKETWGSPCISSKTRKRSRNRKSAFILQNKKCKMSKNWFTRTRTRRAKSWCWQRRAKEIGWSRIGCAFRLISRIRYWKPKWSTKFTKDRVTNPITTCVPRRAW